MKHLLLLFTVTVLISSCKKNTIPVQESTTKNGKLSEFSYRYNNDPAEVCKMSYDSSGRLATYLDSDRKYSFSYNGAASLVVTRTKLSDGAVDQIIECVLNGAGAITKAEYKSNGTITDTQQFLYDASGNLISQKGTGVSGTYENVFTYENGIPVSSKTYDGVTLTRTTHYIYDNSRTNKSGLPRWYNWPSDILYGKPLKYYQKESKEFNANGELINHNKNSFTYDAAGYPLTEVITSLTKNTTQTFTYKF